MEIRNIQIRANSTYPEIVNATNDPRVVMMLKDLLSSREGEIEGLMQYFYQSRIAKNIEPDIAEVLEEISIVEMEHMQLIMDAIVAFGGIPKYDNSRGQMFNASYVNYATKLKDMLDANIIGEEQAINDYIKTQKSVNNQSLKNLLGRIIEDEQLHLTAFKTLRNSVSFLSL